MNKMDTHSLCFEDLINENYITLYNTIDDFNKLLHQVSENELIVSEQIQDKNSEAAGRISTKQLKSSNICNNDENVAMAKLHSPKQPVLELECSSFIYGAQLQKSGNTTSSELQDTTTTFSDAIDTSDLTDTSTSSYFSADKNIIGAVIKQQLKESNFKRKLHRKLKRFIGDKGNAKLYQGKLSETTSSENYQSFDSTSDSSTSTDEEDNDKLKANQSIDFYSATETIEDASNELDKFSKSWCKKQSEEILSKLNEDPLLSFLKFVKNMPNDSSFYNYTDPRTPNCSLDDNLDDEVYYASNEDSFHEVPLKYTTLDKRDSYKSISEKSFTKDSSGEDLRFSLFL